MSSYVGVSSRGLHFRKARTVNFTTNGFPSRIPTNTPPAADDGTATGQAAIDLVGSASPGAFASQGGLVANSVMVCPYGLHASVDNKTMSMRVIGWRPTGANLNDGSGLWIPVVLGEFACTLSGTQVGVAGKTLIATEGFADTIAVTGTTANNGVSVDVVSPANDTIGHVVIDLKGAVKLEFTFTTGGSATSCNALYALL